MHAFGAVPNACIESLVIPIFYGYAAGGKGKGAETVCRCPGIRIFKIDITNGRRIGYNWFAEYGNIFLENRYCLSFSKIWSLLVTFSAYYLNTPKIILTS